MDSVNCAALQPFGQSPFGAAPMVDLFLMALPFRLVLSVRLHSVAMSIYIRKGEK